MSIELVLIICGAVIVLGAILSWVGGWRLLRRWFVVRVRMPLLRRFRYRPKRPSSDHYRFDA
jgi:hypothetical protein